MQIDDFANLTTAGDAVQGLFESPEARARMSVGRRASLAWFRVNGDIERAHTCGVYIRRPRRQGELPVLGVYVDSAARAVDFRANREVYLARLAAAGLPFSDIRFEKTHRPVEHKPLASRGRPEEKPAPKLDPLTPEEEARAREACSKLGDGLREKAYKAMCASMRLQKTQARENGEARP